MISPHYFYRSDDLKDFSRDAFESGHDLRILNSRSFSEGYVELDFSVLLELRFEGDHLPVDFVFLEENIEAVKRPVFILQFQALDSRYRHHWDEEYVFIVDVEIVEGQDIAVPSLVSFHVVDEEIEYGRRGMYASILRKNRFEPIPALVFPDRKVGLAGHSETVSSDEADPHEVESGSKIVGHISDDHRKVTAQHVVVQSVMDVLLPRLRIDVNAGSVMVRRGKESQVELLDVLVGPLDL